MEHEVSESGISEELCRYALGLDCADLPAPVVERTKLLFLDFLAVALGGHRVADSTRTFVDGMRALARDARGSCTVLGETSLFAPQYAAFLNAALAHSMDFDDTHRDAVMHPGAPVFATLLALAEDTGASGADFLAAVVAGYDVVNKVGRAHAASIHERGFHPTATTGVFGATAAGARLLRLPLEQAVNAFGLNVSQAAGSHQFHVNGSWDKRAHTGFAAHNAIASLVLARHGHRGSQDPIEGRWGYFALYAASRRSALPALEGLGTEFEVMNTALKPYPACRCSHSTIDAVLDIVRTEAIGPDDIRAVDIRLTPYSIKIVAAPAEGKRQPKSVVDAQFSIYFAVAAAARGRYDWASYEALHDPATTDLMRRVTVQPDPQLPQYGCALIVTTADGRQIEQHRPFPKGEPEVPMTPAECAAKLRDWSEPVLGAAGTDRLVEAVARLEQLDSMRALTKVLRERD